MPSPAVGAIEQAAYRCGTAGSVVTTACAPGDLALTPALSAAWTPDKDLERIRNAVSALNPDVGEVGKKRTPSGEPAKVVSSEVERR